MLCTLLLYTASIAVTLVQMPLRSGLKQTQKTHLLEVSMFYLLFL